MHNCTDTQAVCRCCGLKLRGSPSWKGGLAYHPEPKGEVHQCHYGGWVCSRRCDIRAWVELEGNHARLRWRERLRASVHLRKREHRAPLAAGKKGTGKKGTQKGDQKGDRFISIRKG
ncbi:hypothetical protein SAMN05216476_2499 [Pseudomonas mediterranea]|uniref:Uncharacterized protein n=1 Tax=Pseudomonas mediterranea TaxID=183795 RepID=A0AAX2DBD5_9PSED|nr:hypothetical protein SAMN05216476_2499 [Pseudomonas mediterranea]